MLGDVITLADALAWIDSGQPFPSIAFVTANSHTHKGGEWIELGECEKAGWVPPAERKRQEALQRPSEGVRKDPRHYENSTRNLRIRANGEIRKVHIRLIRRFNGKTVL